MSLKKTRIKQLPNYNTSQQISDYIPYIDAPTWGALDAAGKQAAVNRATRYLEINVAWTADRVESVSGLHFGDDAEEWTKVAEMEIAVFFVERGAELVNFDKSVTKEQVGPIVVEYGDIPQSGSFNLPAYIMDIMAPHIKNAGDIDTFDILQVFANV